LHRQRRLYEVEIVTLNFGFWHQAECHERLLTGPMLAHHKVARREHPHSAYCRPTKTKFHPEISVNQTVV
jgi:hypothetical protein